MIIQPNINSSTVNNIDEEEKTNDSSNKTNNSVVTLEGDKVAFPSAKDNIIGNDKAVDTRRDDEEGEFTILKKYHREHIDSSEVPNFVRPLKVQVKGVTILHRVEIDQTMSICEIVQKRCPIGWENMFSQAWAELQAVDKFLRSEEEKLGVHLLSKGGVAYYPLKRDIFKAFDLCPLYKVKVVIFGQDPYHSTDRDGLPTAQGLSFSVRRGVRVPPSLRTIYKRLNNTVSGFTTPNHGDLTSWAKQGVLLINTSLTVKPGQANSHSNRWMGVINRMITSLTSFNSDIIYLLWGRNAQAMKRYIGSNGIIFESSHPSPLGARYGFYNMDHFNEVNDKLRELELEPINWCLPN